MNCELARTLTFCRACDGPNSLSPSDSAALDQHLAACAGCGRIAGREMAFDAAVRPVMRDVPVPSAGKANVRRAVAAKVLTRWYRNWAVRAAVALIGVVGAGIGYGVHRASRPAFDAGALVWHQDRALLDPEWSLHNWLAEEGLPARLPADFEMRHCKAFGKLPVQGEDVPFVEFRCFDPQSGRHEIARLLLVSDARFRFGDLSPGQSSYFTSQTLLDDRDGSGYVYVVLYTSRNLDLFLNQIGKMS